MSGKIQLQEAFKLALSMMLFYWLALWNDWDLPKYGALAIVIISLSTTGASLNKGFMRVAGTGLGALAGFVLLSWFSQLPLGMLLATTVYLVITGYFLQTSRQGDTWFNAGAIPANHVTTTALKWNDVIIIPSGEIRPRARSPLRRKRWCVSGRRSRGVRRGFGASRPCPRAGRSARHAT